MLRRMGQALNIITGSFIGVFIGYSAYKCWDFYAHPDLYAMQSAPLYTGIWIYGIFVSIVAAICIVLKFMIRKAEKAQAHPPRNTKDHLE